MQFSLSSVATNFPRTEPKKNDFQVTVFCASEGLRTATASQKETQESDKFNLYAVLIWRFSIMWFLVLYIYILPYNSQRHSLVCVSFIPPKLQHL